MRACAVVAAAVLLLAGCASSSSTPRAFGALVGRVLSAPSCPVERVGMPCPPRPVNGASVDAVQNGDVIASTHTDAAGRFQLQLHPGRYVIRATNAGGYAATAERRILVGAGGPAVVIRLVVDSGIR